MSAPDEVIRQKVVQWLAYGGEDLRLARHAIELAALVRHTVRTALMQEGMTLAGDTE